MNKVSHSTKRNHVPITQLSPGRGRPRGCSNGLALKRGRSTRKSDTGQSNQGLLELLEAENDELRARVRELLLQIQYLRDGVRTLNP
jgi:hypothetical protein